MKKADPEDGGAVDNEFINTGSVKLFSKTTLPSRIRIFDTVRLVDKIAPRIKRCYRCQRFGHIFSSCTHPISCNRCGENHSDQNCENRVRCANCGEDHYASDRDCIYFRFNVEVAETRAAFGINFKEAEAIVQEKYEDEYNFRFSDVGVPPVPQVPPTQEEIVSPSQVNLQDQLNSNDTVLRNDQSNPTNGDGTSSSQMREGGARRNPNHNSLPTSVEFMRAKLTELYGADSQELRTFISLEALALEMPEDIPTFAQAAQAAEATQDQQ